MSMSASTQDPAGLLQRLPELQPLCAEPGIGRAVATGDTFKVYRALWWARLTGKLAPHRRTLDRLLASRRAFAKPLKGTPSLGTLNSVGMSLVGKSEPEPDGTFIATHAFVLLFGVPLFPFGAYVVASGGRSGLTSRWQIFARVPLGAVAMVWRRLVAVAAAAALLVGAWGGYRLWTHQDVWVVNGLPGPVQVTIGPASVRVPAGQHVKVNLPVGTHTARALTAKGEVVDEGPLAVQSGSALLVWNVGGAAPVMEAGVPYYAGTPPANAAEPKPVLHCGERWLSLHGVDFEFREPPDKIEMPKGMSSVIKRVVLVGRQEGMDGAELCAAILENQKGEEAALGVRHARAVVAGE
jgi:hypothetical protein